MSNVFLVDDGVDIVVYESEGGARDKAEQVFGSTVRPARFVGRVWGVSESYWETRALASLSLGAVLSSAHESWRQRRLRDGLSPEGLVPPPAETFERRPTSELTLFPRDLP